MRRNIQALFNMDPTATEEAIRLAALQFIRKVSGFHPPSRANEETFSAAVEAITGATSTLPDHLTTNVPQKDRAEEAARRKAYPAQRFARE